MKDSVSSLNFYLIQVEDDNYDVCNVRTDYKVMVYATSQDAREFLELNDPSHPFLKTHTERLMDRVPSMQLDLFGDYPYSKSENTDEILNEIKDYYAKYFTSPLNETLKPENYSSELHFPQWDTTNTPWSEYDTTTVYNQDYSVTFSFEGNNKEDESDELSDKNSNVIPFLPDPEDKE